MKIIGLSVDPVENHAKWADDIKETQGFAPNYPMIGDTDLKVAKLYGMLPADTPGTIRQAAPPRPMQTVRTVFVIGPDKKIKLHPRLSDDDRPQLRRDPARHRLACSSPPSTRSRRR